MAVGWYVWRNGGPVEVDMPDWAVQRDAEPVKPTGEVPSSLHVAYTVLRDGATKVTISTMFLTIDGRGVKPGPPLLFETMLFWPGSEANGEWERYYTLDGAEQGHQRWVAATQRRLEREG